MQTTITSTATTAVKKQELSKMTTKVQKHNGNSLYEKVPEEMNKTCNLQSNKIVYQIPIHNT